MFEKNNEKMLYWLIDQYLTDKITAWTFSSLYSECYNLRLDSSLLTDKERKLFDELNIIASRFSDVEDDLKMYPGTYFSEQELQRKVIEVKRSLENEYKNTLKFYDGDTLLKACIEALNPNFIILINSKSEEMFSLLENRFPFTKWGKVDWDKINNKKEVGFEPKKIIPTLKSLKDNYDPIVYIFWNNASRPVIKTNLNLVMDHFYDVMFLETFISNPLDGYIIEVLPSYKTNVGIINGSEES